MNDKFIPTLLVTANVGSIFEDPQNLLKIWVKEFLMTVKKFQPKFLALHCQEVGGKNYEESMRHVEDFVRMLMASEEFLNFGQVRVYLDEDFTCTEKFTALGNLYFVHNSLKNVKIWDYKANEFIPVEGKEVHSGNIERVCTKEKAKFPQEFFPECKWSRKGFMRTRWNISDTVFDLINIHLFHDASNFLAMESFPSVYSKNRHNALQYALQRFSTDEYEKVPFFIFGDFNFRLDTKGIIQKLTNQAVPIHIRSSKNGEIEKVLYRDQINENKVILTVEKKVFDVDSHDQFYINTGKWLQEYDKELNLFEDQLFEFEIEFPPSYPFQEDTSSGTSYMKTRCPSWCDRILLSKTARSLINMTPTESGCPPVLYQLIGANVAMGDHKPVMLLFRLLPQTGRPTPFIFKSPVPEITILQFHLPVRRTVSYPPIIQCHDYNVPKRRAVSTAICESRYIDGINFVQNNVSEVIDTTKLSVTWPCRRHLSHHSSSSEEWYSEVPKMCHLSSDNLNCQNNDLSTDNRKVQKKNINISYTKKTVDHSSVHHDSFKDLTKHLTLHADSSKNSQSADAKEYKSCPCVLL